MHVGLWRVGPLSMVWAALVSFTLLAASCSSGAGPADEPQSVATIIGGTAPTAEADAADTASDEDASSALSIAPNASAPSTVVSGSSTIAGPSTTTNSAASTTSGDRDTGSSTSTAPASSTETTAAPTSTTSSTVSSQGTPSGSSGVVGTGDAASCTSRAVVDAIAAGGTITFNCGASPVTIAMSETAKVVNANGPEIVIDGGGLVTLSGQGSRRILYMNTCDQAQGWTTSHCQNQDHPRLTVQNLTFVNGNATGQNAEGGGGGAIFVRGGRLQVRNSTFVGNRCDDTGPDVGGAAIRVLSQFQGLPVTVSGSTFRDGVCSNGGALSSIGVSWVITDSVMTGNRAIGRGANPAKAGTPGGGSGGAIYLDGNTFTLDLQNTRIENNRANEGGGAVFFVSNDRTGRLSITNSTLLANPSDQFETAGFPGIFFLGAGSPAVSNSILAD